MADCMHRLPDARVAAGEDRTLQPIRRSRMQSSDISVGLHSLDSGKGTDVPPESSVHEQESPSTRSHREMPSYFDRLHGYRVDQDRRRSTVSTPSITSGRFKSPSLPPP